MKAIKAYILLYFSAFVVFITTLSSCVKDDFNKASGSVVMTQSFSIPFGSKAFSFSPPPVADTSDISGPFGFFYFDQYKYSNTVAYFNLPSDTIPFNVVESSHEDWIKAVEFSVIIDNSFDTKVVSQIYMCDSNLQLIDQVFTPGMYTVYPTTTYIQKIPMTALQLANLKRTRFLIYQGFVYTSNGDISQPVHFQSKNAATITIGAKIDLQYNIKDL